MASYLRIIRGFSPSVRYYILANAGAGFAYFGIFTVLYNLFLLRLGYSLGLIGQVNGVGQLCWALLALPASVLGRRMGLRNAQVTSSLIIATGYVLFLLVEMLPEPGRIAWLFATTILVWAGAALLTVNGLPYLVGITQPAERSHALAITSSVSALAAVAGSLVAGFLPAQIASLIGAVRGILSQEIVQPLWRTATSAILIMGLAFGWASMALLGSVLIEIIKFSGLMVLSAGCALVSISLLYTYLRRNPSSQVATALKPSGDAA